MKNPFVTILGDKLKLVPSHMQRSQRRHSKQIDQQLGMERRKRWCQKTYLLLELPGFIRSKLCDKLHANLPQTFGMIATYGMYCMFCVTFFPIK